MIAFSMAPELTNFHWISFIRLSGSFFQLFFSINQSLKSFLQSFFSLNQSSKSFLQLFFPIIQSSGSFQQSFFPIIQSLKSFSRFPAYHKKISFRNQADCLYNSTFAMEFAIKSSISLGKTSYQPAKLTNGIMHLSI